MVDKRWVDAALIFSMWLLATWVTSQFGQLAGRQAEVNIANAYGGFAIIALVVLIGASAHVAFLEFIGVNSADNKKIITYLLLGAFVGFIITAQGKSLFYKMLTGAIDPTLGFAFVNILAPVTEAYLFRGAIYPSLKVFLSRQLPNALSVIIAAAVICSVLFMVWHLVASGGDASKLVSYFVLSMIFVGLTEATKSITPELGAHFVLNLING